MLKAWPLFFFSVNCCCEERQFPDSNTIHRKSEKVPGKSMVGDELIHTHLSFHLKHYKYVCSLSYFGLDKLCDD